MIPRPFAEVASVGVGVPPGVLTNADLTRMLDTSDEWIVERTGIRERHIARPEQTVAQLSHEASLRALAAAGTEVEELDAIVLATASPDRLLPSTACDLQALLGAENAAAFDIGAACPGLRLRADGGGRADRVGAEPDGAGGRRREAVDHHRLPGPLDRHPVRRRGGRLGRPPLERTWPGDPLHLHQVGRPARAAAVPAGRRLRGPDQREGGLRAVALHEDGGARGLQGRRARDGRRVRRGACAGPT